MYLLYAFLCKLTEQTASDYIQNTDLIFFFNVVVCMTIESKDYISLYVPFMYVCISILFIIGLD